MSVACQTFAADSAFYFALGQIFIIADHPDAPTQMQRCPDCPVINRKALDLIVELTASKATVEGKLRLLRDCLEVMVGTPGNL